jgi:hypothetical protein
MAANGSGRQRREEMAERLLLRHEEPVLNVHFTGDGARVVTATDQRAPSWDPATGAQIYTTTAIGNHLADALLRPGTRQLFHADIAFGDACLRDILTEQVTTTSAMIQAQCAALAPRQRGILLASWDDQLRRRSRVWPPNCWTARPWTCAAARPPCSRA